MTSTDGQMEEAIRDILASGEEATHGWSDQQIIAEARRRAGAADSDHAMMDRWEILVTQLRSGTDNDGQTRAQ
ncbi:MAG: hypothetical protein ACR2JW_18265 [Thermomicrobiales bacterium]